MARAFVDDRWLKNDEDGNPPSRAAKQSLANAKDPMKANVPGKWRSALYGQGSRWRCRWYTLRDGKRVQKSRNFAKLRDAEEYAAAIEDDIRRGKYRDPQQELRIFRDVASEWTDGKMDIKQGTLGRYRRELRVYINPKWGDRTLREIQRDELQQWVTQLTEGGYPAELQDDRESKPLSPRSIRNIVKVVMGGVMEFALEHGWIGENPIEKVTVPRITQSDDDMVFLTVEEVELLAGMAERAGRPVDGLIVRWQAYTGARIGETLALKCGDVDGNHAGRASAALGPTTAKAGLCWARRRTANRAASPYPDSLYRPSNGRWRAWATTTGCSARQEAGTCGRTRGGRVSGERPSDWPAWRTRA